MMTAPTPTGLGNQSCQRCYGRKKKCDRHLPRCKRCVQANAKCSFEEAGAETGIFEVSYVRALEERVRHLERELQHCQTSGTLAFNTESPGNASAGQSVVSCADSRRSAPAAQHQNDVWSTGSSPGRNQQEIGPEHTQVDESPESLESGLKVLSLEATADRYLGSSSGVTFARLTQAVLKRLKPDLQSSPFQESALNIGSSIQNRPSAVHEGQDNFRPEVPAKEILTPLIPMSDMPLPDQAHAYRLAEYYWSHSHTLYPFVRRAWFMDSLEKIYANPNDPVLRSSHTWLYTMWMVFAIGSTSLSSVMISDETESIQYWKAAMFHFDATLDEGNMAALNGILLQVSYSWFNQVGPNTWYLVGMAIRLALGIGLHTNPAKTEAALPRHVQEYRARMFFSLYMMDRLVSITLGRPLGIRDEDIEIEPFAAADDASILPDQILPHTGLNLPSTAVPLHILALRRIAGEIFQEVYSNKNLSLTNDSVARDTIIQNLHEKLILWRRNMPFPLPESQNLHVPHLSATWFDFNYHNHVIMLYRPSPLCPVITVEKVAILADASVMSLRHATTMHRQRRFAFNWLNLLSIFTTSLALIYTITAQPEQLSNYLRRSNALDDLRLATKLLETFTQKFQIAKKYRDMVLGVIARLEAQLHNQETQMDPASTVQPQSNSQLQPNDRASRSPPGSSLNLSMNSDLVSQHSQSEMLSSDFGFTPNSFHQKNILGLFGSPQQINFHPMTENFQLVTQVFQTPGLFDDLEAQHIAFGFDGSTTSGVLGVNSGFMELDDEAFDYLDPRSRDRDGEVEHQSLDD